MDLGEKIESKERKKIYLPNILQKELGISRCQPFADMRIQAY